MGCVLFTTLEAVVIVGLLWLASLKGTHGQRQDPVIALEATEVELIINIPNNQITNGLAFITIRYDNGSGLNLTEVVISVNGLPRLKEDYENIMSATQIGKRLTLRLKNVVASLAGTYRCYVHSSYTVIDDCGQLLIVIRKPNPSTIKLLPPASALVGSRLVLVCESSTTSMPPNHGLASKNWWHDQSGALISQGSQRILVSAQSQLVIDPVERTDKGKKFYCITADSTGDVTKEIKSDKSADFELMPEYEPSPQDFVFTPTFGNGDIIVRGTDEQISYKCQIDCSPQCNIVWMYKPSTGSTDFGEFMGLTDKQVLVLKVNRAHDGFFKCRAENKYGATERGFNLQTAYLEAPTISINKEVKTTARLPEYSQVRLMCEFDSYPAPVVNWISPSQDLLFTHTAVNPVVVVDGGINKHLFNSTYDSNSLKCEDSGLFRCDGRNSFSSVEGRMELVITCPPSSANIPDLDLKQEYVWEIPKPLRFQFVIRAFPVPNVTQIISSLYGVMQDELIPKDVEISKTLNYNGKSYLTKFDLTSKRNLDENDAGRAYTMTLESSDFKKSFVFHINPRGPPHKVVNLTATDISHNSLVLFWLPGFSGGEPQAFSVEHRVHSGSEVESSGQQQKNYTWTPSLEKIPSIPDNWIKVKVESLRAETDYVLRVMAINVLGSSVAEIKIRTAAASESLGAGAICGIVFGVIIVLAIIALVIYFVIYRKKFGTRRGHGGTRKAPFLQQITAFFRRDKHKSRPGTGARLNGSATNESPWGKVRKMIMRRSPRNSMDYLNVPPKDYNIEDSSSALNNNALSSGSPESGRKMNDEGLIYVEVEFAGDKQKNKQGKDKKKKKKKQTENVHKSNESVDYSDIDFSKTAARRIGIEEEGKRGEARQEDDDPGNEDNASAVSMNKYADAGFGIGTTV